MSSSGSWKAAKCRLWSRANLSIALCRRIWDRGPTGTARFLLLCLGDHADESGHAYPSLDRLADRCTLTKRSVISTLNLLEKDGWLKRIKKGRKSEYQIVLAKLGISEATSSITLPTGEEPSRMTGENASPVQPPIGEVERSEKVKSTAAIGEISCNPPTPPYRRTTKEPPVESQLRRYRAAREAGKFAIHGWSDANFVSGGHWKDEQTWPWKPEHRPERKMRYCDPARLYDGPEYQPAALARSHDSAETAAFSPVNPPQTSQTQKANA
jgi:hypothetical protein